MHVSKMAFVASTAVNLGRRFVNVCMFASVIVHKFTSSCMYHGSSLVAVVQGGGFSWLFPFQNGAPPIGWHDAICYLVLPVALVVSQFITQKILQPPSQDESAQQTNAILKFLPLMIGEW